MLANGYDFATPAWAVVVVIAAGDTVVLVSLSSIMLVYHYPHPRYPHPHLLTHRLLEVDASPSSLTVSCVVAGGNGRWGEAFQDHHQIPRKH